MSDIDKKCYHENAECAGEIKAYWYRLGTAAEIREEDEITISDPPYKRGFTMCVDFCETHKRGKLYVQKPMRPSLPYQGIGFYKK